MRYYYIPVFLCCLATGIKFEARGSHAAGGELLYEWVSDSTYKFIFKFYRDCSGVAAPPYVSMCFSSECQFVTSSIRLNPPGPGVEIGTGCPGYPTRCSGGALPGYQEYIYEGYLTLPVRCHKWRFWVGVEARNTAIGNLALPFNDINMYVEATLNNLVAQGNSSPVFYVQPIPYVCVGVPYVYNNGAMDVDGDRIVYEPIIPRTGPNTNSACGGYPPQAPDMAFLPGYGLPDNPFATNQSYHLDTVSGLISFTPSLTQIAVVGTRIREYRNGIEIGSVMRDIQVIVRNDCYSSPIMMDPDLPSFVNSVWKDNRVEGCVQTPLSFCMDLVAPMDRNAVLVVSDNHGRVLPGLSVSYTGQQSHSVKACIQWIPDLQDTGLHVLLLTVKDSTCRPPGVLTTQVFTLPVYIWPQISALRNDTICPYDPVALSVVSGRPSFTWDVLPGGAPLTSLSCTACTDPVARPGVTTSYIVASDSNLCRKKYDTVTITVLPAPDLAVTGDTVICVQHLVPLNVAVRNGAGLPYDITWTPPAGLNNNKIHNPVAVATRDITYVVRVEMEGMSCVSEDSVHITVLQGYDLLTGDTAICTGDTLIPNVQGDSRYGYSWSPPGDMSDPGVMRPQIWPARSGTYVLTASYPGCRDSIRSLYVDVQPIPDVYAGADSALCAGDTFTLQPVISPGAYPYYTYTWTPPGSLNNSSVANPLFTAVSPVTLTLTVSTPAGCKGQDDVLVDVIATDFITAGPDTLICPGDTAQLFVEGDYVSHAWSPSAYMNDTAADRPLVYPEQSTIYTVRAVNSKGCVDQRMVTVTVAPQAVVSLPDSARIFPGEGYQMDPSGNCLYFEWFPPLGLTDTRIANPFATPEVNTRYFVTGKTEHGCTGLDSIDIYVSSDSYIDMPNAFIPGTGPNGLLRPVRKGMVEIRAFKVFNRWGMKVFETSVLDAGWDGQYKGVPQPVGVYVYIVEAETPAGRLFYKQGNVTLLR